MLLTDFHTDQPRTPSAPAATMTEADMRRYLTATGDLQLELFARARDVRRAHGVDDVKLRGVIEISNFCQKTCDYCAIRGNNKSLDRYRMAVDDIMAIFRILFPRALVPTVSAMEKLRKGGQLDGLNAGANVITINFTPQDCRDKYAIYSAKDRFVVNTDHAHQIIGDAGLHIRAPH